MSTSVLLREHVVKRFTRSKDWPRARRAWLQLNNTCANCGKTATGLRKFFLCVHHIVPVHVKPEWELVPTNFITLCSNPRCHLDKGHLGNWKSWNSSVTEDCKNWLEKYTTRPYKPRG